MTTQIICLLIGCLIPLIWSGAALPYRQRQLGRVDFEQPRVQANSLTGRGASVVGAQMNSWEALILFAVANLCGHFGELDPLGAWSILSIVWVVARLFHGYFYLYEKVKYRIASFMVSALSSFAIITLALLN
tara:strand:+ start:213 stop:608 length:396 start_codon:yes stop_codon:yes gene_type:complete